MSIVQLLTQFSFLVFPPKPWQELQIGFATLKQHQCQIFGVPDVVLNITHTKNLINVLKSTTESKKSGLRILRRPLSLQRIQSLASFLFKVWQSNLSTPFTTLLKHLVLSWRLKSKPKHHSTHITFKFIFSNHYQCWYQRIWQLQRRCSHPTIDLTRTREENPGLRIRKSCQSLSTTNIFEQIILHHSVTAGDRALWGVDAGVDLVQETWKGKSGHPYIYQLLTFI